MKKAELFIFLLPFLTSCATLLNKEYVRVEIHTPASTQLVILEDTFLTEDNFLELELYRQGEPLPIQVISDSSFKEIELQSRLSPAFYGSLTGILFGAPFVEFTGDKIYTFPKSIYIDASSSSFDYQYFSLPQKGEWYLYSALPYMNHILWHNDREDNYIHRTGYLGFSLGLEYYYQTNRFIRFSASHTSAYENIGDRRDLEIEEFSLISKYLSITHHHRWNRFSFGYGLGYQRREIFKRSLNNNNFGSGFSSRIINDWHNAFSIPLPAAIQLNSQLYLGFIYMPSLYLAPSPLAFRYEHVFTVEIAWKPRIFRGR
jgi:hypothetical protein